VVLTPTKPRQEGADSQSQVKVLGSSFPRRRGGASLERSGAIDGSQDENGGGGDYRVGDGDGHTVGEPLPRADLIKGQTAEEGFD